MNQLASPWLDLYNHYTSHHGNSPDDNKIEKSLFKEGLFKYLYSCQKRRQVPDQEHILSKCAVIQEESARLALKPKPDRLDYNRAFNSIMYMDYSAMLIPLIDNKSGEHSPPTLRISGIVDCSLLSESEEEFILSHFEKQYGVGYVSKDESFNSLIITLFTAVLFSEHTEEISLRCFEISKNRVLRALKLFMDKYCKDDQIVFTYPLYKRIVDSIFISRF